MKQKKYLLIGILLIILIISSCLLLRCKDSTNLYIETNIEENKQYLISVNYPKIGIKKLDTRMEHLVEQQIDTFKENVSLNSYLIERDELNIDYELYMINNRYINISLKIYIYHHQKEKAEYYLETFCFDKKKDDFYEVFSIFSEPDKVLDIINEELGRRNLMTISQLTELSYLISEDELIVYDLRNGFTTFSVSLEQFSLMITIQKKESTFSEVTVDDSKVLDPLKPSVAITFDDGPSEYTKDIIRTLKEEGCNATFFVLGNKVETYQEVLKESIQNGNEIGNHSYNHKWLSRLSKDEIISQVNKTQEIIFNTTGYTPTHLRPTYGAVNDRIRKNIDLEITLWTIDTKDWKIKNVDRIVERALKNIEDGDIILMHDIFERSSEALKKLIPLLKEKGYQLVTISELEEIKLLRTRY